MGAPKAPWATFRRAELPSSGHVWYYSLLRLDFVACSEKLKLKIPQDCNYALQIRSRSATISI